MWQAFAIVLREGVEAFLIVAITLAYLRKTGQNYLVRAVAWGILGAVFASGGLGYFLWLTQGANQPLWEGIFGLVTVILVASLIVHMWKVGPKLKQEMEGHLQKVTTRQAGYGSLLGVFFFTLVMISREGMETALLLFQIHEPAIVSGIFLGILAAAAIAFLWQQFGYLINLKRFFQVTAVYLMLFTLQIFVQSFHEFTEAGLFPNSEAWHIASEPYSLEGIYGKMFSTATVIGCGLWLIVTWMVERSSVKKAVRAPVEALKMPEEQETLEASVK